MVRIKGSVQLLDHELPFDLKFDIDVASLNQFVDLHNDEYEGFSFYMSALTGADIIVTGYDLYAE